MIIIDPRALAHALGGEAHGTRIQAPGPGHSNQDRSLSILVDPHAPDGFVVESFAGDDWRDCKEHVRSRLGSTSLDWASGSQRINAATRRSSREEEQSDADRTRFALSIWRVARLPKGTLVETYLAARGLSLGHEVIRADALRFHPACPFGADRHPAMVALMRDIITNEPKAIHRTALKPDGSGKAGLSGGRSPKRMLGPARGAAVKLIDDAEVTIGLGIAEGIENALTAICAGWLPVWATGCKGAVASFPVLAGIEALTVISDPEPGGVQAAHQCARRWHKAGREATVIEPKWAGSDINDLLGYAR
jgi:hypothetical protein